MAAGVDTPKEATKAAAYATPNTVSKLISAIVVAQVNVSTEQAKRPQFYDL
jgi:hypothetical protein